MSSARPASDTAERAAYIARVLAGLQEIAEATEGLAMLGYLVGVAREEAETRAPAPTPRSPPATPAPRRGGP